MGTSVNELQSFRPYHPGELIKEELECRNIKQKDFANKFELFYAALNEILNTKRSVTTEFALLLELALGINADLPVKMQTDYNLPHQVYNKPYYNLLKTSESLLEIMVEIERATEYFFV